MISDYEIRKLDEQYGRILDAQQVRKPAAVKVTLVCNECGKKRQVSPDGNFNDRCPRCGGVDWDVL